ncbi:GrpE protein 2, mitochondrial [Asimina triloba]
MTQYSFPRGIIQQFGFSSSASPRSNEKENQFEDRQGRFVDKGDVSLNISEVEANMESNVQGQHSEPSDKGEHPVMEDVLSANDLVKVVAEKEELLKLKQEEVEQMKDKVLRSYAEMENVIARTKREAENSKKFAIQSFAKSLLDVADNLARASSVVKDSFSKVDQSKDSGAVPLLKALLEGVEMTDKQLTEVFKKFGVEKFDPINEQFDPNRHNAVFQMPDASKPAGTVAAVLKCGYVLYDRVIRPAEVGVTEAASNEEANV